MIFQILPRYDYNFQQDNMMMFLKTLTSIKIHSSFFDGIKKLFQKQELGVLDFQYIVDCDQDEKISFYFQVDDSVADIVKNALQNMFQEKADVFETKELEVYTTVQTLYTPSIKKEDNEECSLATFQNEDIFFYILGMLRSYTRMVVDFNIKNSVAKKTYKGISSEVTAEVMIKVSGKTKYQRNILTEITNTIRSLLAGEKKVEARFRDVYKTSLLTGSELLNLVQFPTLFQKSTELSLIKNIHRLEIGQRTLADNEFNKGIKCGKVCHPMQDRDVLLDEMQLRKHMFVTGQTGSGKSSAAEEIMKDILQKKVQDKNKAKTIPGFTFFDPAETSVLGVIDMLLKLEADGYDITELKNMIHYIDFSYDNCIFPISLLNKDVPVTEILDYFKSLFGESPTIQVDRMVTSAINTLLMDEGEYTILDVPKLFQDENMREEIAIRLSKNIYADDSVRFLKSKFNPNQVDPILNRTDPFVNTGKKKLMFGLPSKFDGFKKIAEWIEEGHIILFNTKGLNDVDNKIVMGYMSLKYYLYGLSRNDNALLHIVFQDEAHKTQFQVLQRWLAELRKKGLALVPMTQFLDQFDPKYLQALLGNVGTKISFRQGDDSARRLVHNLPGKLDKEANYALIQLVYI